MKKLLLLLTCAVLLCGCADTESKIVTPTAETRVTDPDFAVKDDIEIDWEQVSVDAGDVFQNKSDYPYSEDFHFMLQPDTKKIMLVWVVSDDLPSKELRNYAEALIKGFNDIVAIQDFSIEKSSADSYGGLWDTYGLSYGIAPASMQDDEDSWFISGSYDAGVKFELPDVMGALENAKKAEQGDDAAASEETQAE